MKAGNFTKEESDNAPEVRLNKATRDELGVKVNDKVKIVRVTTEVIEADVHQARKNQIDEVRLIGGNFEEEKDPEVEILKLDDDTTERDGEGVAEDNDDLDDDFEDDN